MIIILSGVVALGSLVLLDCNGKEELGTFVFCGILGLLVLITIFLSNFGEQYEDYTESYPLQQMADGSYYSTSGSKINVMTMDGNMQKPKTFSIEKVSFVNGNTASVQIQGEKTADNRILETFFFYKTDKRDKVKSVIISVPENSSENPLVEDIEKPLTGNFCTSCGAAIKENGNFCSSCGQKIKSE